MAPKVSAAVNATSARLPCEDADSSASASSSSWAAFAQFAKAAGRGIAFQRVHDPPDAAHDFRVGRTLFQLQRLFVERLQQFLRGLEEEFAQFGAALIGKLGHPLTSTCW